MCVFPKRTCSVGCTIEESNDQGNVYDKNVTMILSQNLGAMFGVQAVPLPQNVSVCVCVCLLFYMCLCVLIVFECGMLYGLLLCCVMVCFVLYILCGVVWFAIFVVL